MPPRNLVFLFTFSWAWAPCGHRAPAAGGSRDLPVSHEPHSLRTRSQSRGSPPCVGPLGQAPRAPPRPRPLPSHTRGRGPDCALVRIYSTAGPATFELQPDNGCAGPSLWSSTRRESQSQPGATAMGIRVPRGDFEWVYTDQPHAKARYPPPHAAFSAAGLPAHLPAAEARRGAKRSWGSARREGWGPRVLRHCTAPR